MRTHILTLKLSVSFHPAFKFLHVLVSPFNLFARAQTSHCLSLHTYDLFKLPKSGELEIIPDQASPKVLMYIHSYIHISQLWLVTLIFFLNSSIISQLILVNAYPFSRYHPMPIQVKPRKDAKCPFGLSEFMELKIIHENLFSLLIVLVCYLLVNYIVQT